jgi:hypothetical protein
MCNVEKIWLLTVCKYAHRSSLFVGTPNAALRCITYAGQYRTPTLTRAFRTSLKLKKAFPLRYE